MEFEKVKSITRPVIKFSGTPTIVQISGTIYLGEKIDGGTAAQKAMEPPHMAEAIDMGTGEEGIIIFGAVLLSEITKAYPGDTYIGKYFSISKKNAAEGKKYSLWSVHEVKPKSEPKK